MIKIALLISKICFDKFGGCDFLQFSKEVWLIEGVELLVEFLFGFWLFWLRGLRLFLHLEFEF